MRAGVRCRCPPAASSWEFSLANERGRSTSLSTNERRERVKVRGDQRRHGRQTNSRQQHRGTVAGCIGTARVPRHEEVPNSEISWQHRRGDARFAYPTVARAQHTAPALLNRRAPPPCERRRRRSSSLTFASAPSDMRQRARRKATIDLRRSICLLSDGTLYVASTASNLSQRPPFRPTASTWPFSANAGDRETSWDKGEPLRVTAPLP